MLASRLLSSLPGRPQAQDRSPAAKRLLKKRDQQGKEACAGDKSKSNPIEFRHFGLLTVAMGPPRNWGARFPNQRYMTTFGRCNKCP